MICDRALYRRLTQDYDSYDGDVDVALADAQNLIEHITDRHFELADYTESLPVRHSGKVYPSAIPVVSVVGVDSSAIVNGNSIRWWGLGNVSGYNWADLGGDISVTYTGGYGEADMPPELKSLVARVAYAVAHPPAATSAVPRGATAVRIGDVQVTYKDGASSTVLSSALLAEIRTWRRPDAGSVSLAAPVVDLQGGW
jgi:hypothetical protein